MLKENIGFSSVDEETGRSGAEHVSPLHTGTLTTEQ
jgi:hypothetical protein